MKTARRINAWIAARLLRAALYAANRITPHGPHAR
jgi:hypothetical protein